MSAAPLSLVLEFARAQQAGDPYAFRFVPQEYLLRGAGGGFDSARLGWDEALLSDLSAVRQPGRDPALLARIGETLRRFLAPLGWAVFEQQIVDACQRAERVVITIRSAAAELYALPWELVTVKATGQHLGEMPGVLLRYEWPETVTVDEQPTPRTDAGRILLAWSAAAGAVPAAAHLEAIHSACRAGFHPFDPSRDVLAQVSCRRLAAVLQAAQEQGPPISVVHLLCHGAAVGSTFGLVLDADDDDAGAGPVIVDAGRLRQLLARYAGMVRLVVLAACDSGNPGTLANQLGSVAQTLHRAGIATVVASRYPLSVSGSIRLTTALYQRLLGGPDSLESAVVAARASLAQESASLDWLSVQLYARVADGTDSRPVVFRPYRGLAAFLPADRRFYFGRTRDVGRIVKLLAGGARLVSVVGASGSGKSSLVLAGVVPVVAGAAAAGVCVVRPGLLPCQALAVALAAMDSPAAQTPATASGQAIAELRHNLLKRPETLTAWAASSPARLLLVVDQFEELFLQADRSEAAAFIGNLLHAIAVANGRVVAVLTLRADFLGLGLESPGLAEALRATLTLVLPLDQHDLREAIEGPAALCGLTFEEGLVDALLDGLLDTAAVHPAEPDRGGETQASLTTASLPLLQFTLEQLWEQRRAALISWQAWRAIGGVRGAIARRANEVLESARRAGEEALVQKLFGRLVQLGEGTIDTRRRARREEVEAIAPGRMKHVLHRWVDARLITTDAAEVTIAHEALIREWETLRRWIADSRESLHVLQALSRAAERYGNSGQSVDDLWHGTPLRRALTLQAEGRLPLSAAEAEFLFRSAAAVQRQAELALAQAQLAHDSDVEVGQKSRTFGVVMMFSMATVSYLWASVYLHKVTQEMFLIQTLGLAASLGMTLFQLRKARRLNDFNRKVLLLGFGALLPIFMNHLVSWLGKQPVWLTQVFNINVLLAVGLAGAVTIDPLLGWLTGLFIPCAIAGTLRPQWVGLIFGVMAPAAAAHVIWVLRRRARRKKQPATNHQSDPGVGSPG